MCARESVCEREREKASVCVCVREREREGECVCLRESVCVRMHACHPGGASGFLRSSLKCERTPFKLPPLHSEVVLPLRSDALRVEGGGWRVKTRGYRVEGSG